MQRELDLFDIQGNVPRAYGRYSFPFSRYFFLHVDNPASGRAFVEEARHLVTTAARWSNDNKPNVTLNIGFTFLGLYALQLPTRTLRSMPFEFIDGMKARAHVLGDRAVSPVQEHGDEWCKHWDPIWRANRSSVTGENDVHIWMSMNAQAKEWTDQPVDDLDQQTAWLRDLCGRVGDGVRILGGHGRSDDADFQSGKAIFAGLPNGAKVPTAREHFGFTDGIGDPVFEGQYPKEDEDRRVIGRGKFMEPGKWEPLAAGEFVLGYPDEAQELPPAAVPFSFARNGSFMVYRKLHQNVGSFRQVIEEEAERFAKIMDVDHAEAVATLKAKIVGRWPDGVPLAVVPTHAEWQALRTQRGFDDPDPTKAAEAQYAYLKSSEPVDFRYADDMMGYKCPGGAHLRRVNTRDYLDPLNKPDSDNPNATTQLNKRRRILRRGLPYGDTGIDEGDDSTEQGVIFMVVNSSIFRQFEFVQQQWIEYGLDFNVGNNTCPLLGNHEVHKRHLIPSDPNSGKRPYVIDKLKTFVETRGGDYFFLPSMSALRMIAMGSTDPT